MSSSADIVARLLRAGGPQKFYSSRIWRRVRRQVLELYRGECVMCRDAGRYTPATTVHHVKHLLDRPDLGLSITDPDTGEPQLIPLCDAHHIDVHGRCKWQDERW